MDIEDSIDQWALILVHANHQGIPLNQAMRWLTTAYPLGSTTWALPSLTAHGIAAIVIRDHHNRANDWAIHLDVPYLLATIDGQTLNTLINIPPARIRDIIDDLLD